MCHFYEEGQKTKNKMGGTRVEDYFPLEFVQAFPPTMSVPGRCLVCAKPLSPEEMFPRKLTPRYMCQPCYETAAYNAPKDRCLLWGMPLPDSLAKERERNPRELKNALCQGYCFDYWSMLAGRVLGVQFNTNYALPPAQEVPAKLPCSNERRNVKAIPDLKPMSANDVIAEFQHKHLKVRYKGFPR